MDELLELLKDAKIHEEFDLRWHFEPGDANPMGKHITSQGNLDTVMSVVNSLTDRENQHYYWQNRLGLVLFRKLTFSTPYHEFARYSRG